MNIWRAGEHDVGIRPQDVELTTAGAGEMGGRPCGRQAAVVRENLASPAVTRQVGEPPLAGEDGDTGRVLVDRHREPAELLAFCRPVRRCGQSLLRVPQPRFDRLQVAGHQHPPGIEGAEHRSAAYDVVGNAVEPAQQYRVTTFAADGRNGSLDEQGSPLEVIGSQRVADRFRRHAVPLVPLAGASTQGGDLVGVVGQHAHAQDVGEQVVVAVPAALVVERDDEHPHRGDAASIAVRRASGGRRCSGCPWNRTASRSRDAAG